MEEIRRHLQSTTNRLVAAIIAVHVIMTALFAGAPSGLELYSYNNPQFRVWQIITSVFLHADWVHLALNMLALWSFGRVLERVWGGRRFLQFFLLCGIGASLLHLSVNEYRYTQLTTELAAAGLTSSDFAKVTQQGLDISGEFENVSTDELRNLFMLYNSPALGASGAVYGVLVAFALLFPSFKVMLIILPIPIAAKVFVPILLLIDLTAGLTGFSIFGANIAHFAHLGGALVGFLLVQWWLRGARP